MGEIFLQEEILKDVIDNVKFKKLYEELKSLGSAIIGFTGGIDASFLIKVGKMALKDNIHVVLLTSKALNKYEIEEARKFISILEVNYSIVDIEIPSNVTVSQKNTCEECREKIYSKIKKISEEKGIKNIINDVIFTENFIDMDEKYLSKYKVKTPLKNALLTKNEIRELSKKLGISTENTIGSACLLERIPYGRTVDEYDLRRVELAESYLKKMGFKGVKVKNYGDLASVVFRSGDLEEVLDVNVFKYISKAIKSLGFRRVSLDMEGYNEGYNIEDK